MRSNRQSDMDSKYKEKGFLDRDDYLLFLFKKFNIDKKIVYMLSYTLGEREDFDQLITELGNYGGD